MKVEGESSPDDCSGHRNHTHGVGVTRAWTPASQDDDNVSLFEEASGLAWKINVKHLTKYCIKLALFLKQCLGSKLHTIWILCWKHFFIQGLY